MNINHISVHPGRLSDQFRALTAPLVIPFIFSLFCRIWPRSNSPSGEAPRAASRPYPGPGTVALRDAGLVNEEELSRVTIRTTKPAHPPPGKLSWAPKTPKPFHTVHGAANLGSGHLHRYAGSKPQSSTPVRPSALHLRPWRPGWSIYPPRPVPPEAFALLLRVERSLGRRVLPFLSVSKNT